VDGNHRAFDPERLHPHPRPHRRARLGGAAPEPPCSASAVGVRPLGSPDRANSAGSRRGGDGGHLADVRWEDHAAMECVVRVHAANLSPPRSPANGASRRRWFDFPNLSAAAPAPRRSLR
jgi:hypothetical protein